MTIVLTEAADGLDEDGYGRREVLKRGLPPEEHRRLQAGAVAPNKAAIMAALRAAGTKRATLHFSGIYRDGTVDGADRDGKKDAGDDFAGTVHFLGDHGGHGFPWDPPGSDFPRWKMSVRNAMDGFVLNALKRHHGDWAAGEHWNRGSAVFDAAKGTVTLEVSWGGPAGGRSTTVI